MWVAIHVIYFLAGTQDNRVPGVPFAWWEIRAGEDRGRLTGSRTTSPKGYHKRGFRQFELQVVGLKEKLAEPRPIRRAVPQGGRFHGESLTEFVGSTAQGHEDGLLGFSACGLGGRTQVAILGIIRLTTYCVEYVTLWTDRG